MSDEVVRALASLAPFLAQPPWDLEDIREVGLRESKVRGGADDSPVLQSDGALNDAYWRILALFDPATLPNAQRLSWAHTYAAVKERLITGHGVLPAEAQRFARPVATFLVGEIGALLGKPRTPLSSRTKRQLVAEPKSVRCWYCGYHFSAAAVEQFVLGKQVAGSLPYYVDFVAPRGKTWQDLRIEVDHGRPVARGGGSDVRNLRISCGWCNRHKSALSLVYDAPLTPGVFMHPRDGLTLVPRPFWVIRTRATRRSCEHAGGCPKTAETSELFVARRASSGAMVPGNLATYCELHDPMAASRLVVNDAARLQGAAGP